MQRYIVGIIILSIFLCKGVEGSEDWENDSYELKLEIGKLVDKVKTLEEKLSSTQDILQSMKSEHEVISSLTSRLEHMEQKHEESSIETMNTLKKAVADLRKSMEVQDITISLLEKKSIVAQKPLEPIKKTIENQVMVISEIVAQLKEEKEMIGKQMVSSESLCEKFDKILNMFPDLKEKIFISNILKTQGYQDIGGEFYIKGIAFVPFGLSMEYTGTVLNASGTDHNTANFRMFLYDDMGMLLMNHDFAIRGIKRASVKFFSEIITGVNMEKIGKYAIVFGKNSKPGQLIDFKNDNFEDEDLVNIEEKLWELQALDGK
ncbi:MAG: hypothetical protein ACUZ8E_05000 [Candidatus Anammoxibacter sp.]